MKIEDDTVAYDKTAVESKPTCLSVTVVDAECSCQDIIKITDRYLREIFFCLFIFNQYLDERFVLGFYCDGHWHSL